MIIQLALAANYLKFPTGYNRNAFEHDHIQSSCRISTSLSNVQLATAAVEIIALIIAGMAQLDQRAMCK